MNIEIPTLLWVIPPLLLIEAIFAGTEIALLSIDKVRLRTLASRGGARERLMLELAEHPERILPTTLIMTNLCVIVISSLIALFVIEQGWRHSELVAIALTSPLIVIFGELVPKTLFQKNPERFARWFSPLVRGAYIAFYPLTSVMARYTVRLTRMIRPIEEVLGGRKPGKRDELRSMLSFGKRESDLKLSEKRLIKRIFEFKDSEAKHCLIPLVRVEAIDVNAQSSEALERFKRHRHSRMPVFDGRIDNIIGVLELTDLATLRGEVDAPIRNLVSPARYVAETQALRELIREMREEEDEMVIVVDEYGGAVGILTFEDIVEEIVGEIRDEYESTSSPYQALEDGSYLVQARMLVREINEQIKIDLPEGDYETLGGFLLQQFGRIPEAGDELLFETGENSLKFTIRKANERAIELVRVDRSTKADSSDQA